MFLGRKKGKRLPRLDQTPLEPSSQKLLENFGHEISKKSKMTNVHPETPSILRG
jgi:hypothetical protein